MGVSIFATQERLFIPLFIIVEEVTSSPPVRSSKLRRATYERRELIETRATRDERRELRETRATRDESYERRELRITNLSSSRMYNIQHTTLLEILDRQSTTLTASNGAHPKISTKQRLP